MAQAQKPDFVFRRNGRVHLNRRERVSSVDYWQASCAHQPVGFVLLAQACVLQSCDAYWLPTPFDSFHFTSPPVRHRVPPHFRRSPKLEDVKQTPQHFNMWLLHFDAWLYTGCARRNVPDFGRAFLMLTLRWLMSYIYGAPILDVSRSHTTTQHSR